jgi:catechol 2,3-dioxygenase-like lactoylglutathione lyase family enzyme
VSDNVFHVSLTVRDLDAAVDRYRKILGLEPAKLKTDYAKFEIADPPVVLSLNLGEHPGKLNHLGIRFPGSGELMTERARSTRDGLDVIDQPNAECCYVRADKYWVRDEDGVLWEMYTAHEDIESHSAADRDVSATRSGGGACGCS